MWLPTVLGLITSALAIAARFVPVREEREDLLLTRREPARRVVGGLRGGRRTRDQPAHTRHEEGRVERLDEVVVGAEEHPGGSIEVVRLVGRDQDDGQLLAELIAQLSAELEAADVGQPDVEHHQDGTRLER